MAANPEPPSTTSTITSTKKRRRPWRQIFDYHALSLPRDLHDAIYRLKTNLTYFQINFAMIVLFLLFLSLLWHPVSLIVFFLAFIPWSFLYLLRTEPLELFSRSISDWVVIAGLSVLTVVFLLMAGAGQKFLVFVAVGVAIVVVYSVFRRSDDLFLDEEAATGDGLVAGPDNYQRSTLPTRWWLLNAIIRTPASV